MLVIAKNFVMSGRGGEGDGSDPNSPMIGWESLVRPAGIVADYEVPEFPATNMGNVSTAEPWVSTEDGDQYVTFSLGDIYEVDYIAFAMHNLGSTYNAILIEYRAAPDQPWEALTADFILADDAPVIVRADPVSASQVRMRLYGGSAPPRIAVVYVGSLLLLPRNIYVGHTPINFGRRARVVSGRTESGQFLGRIVLGQSKTTSVQLRHLNPTWYRQRMDRFIQSAVERPFFFSWRPQDYPREVGYAWFPDNHVPRPANQLPNGMMEINFDMEAIAGEAGETIIAPPDDVT